MVEAAAPASRADIRNKLKTRYVAIFDTMEQHELKIEEEQGNI